MCRLCFDWEKNKDNPDIEPEILSNTTKDEDLKNAFEKMFGKFVGCILDLVQTFEGCISN